FPSPREAREVVAELALAAEAAGLGELRDPRVVLEVARPEPHHVVARHAVALGVRIDVALAAASGRRIDGLVEGHWPEVAALERDDRARAAREQVVDRRVPEVARVLGV